MSHMLNVTILEALIHVIFLTNEKIQKLVTILIPQEIKGSQKENSFMSIIQLRRTNFFLKL